MRYIVMPSVDAPLGARTSYFWDEATAQRIAAECNAGRPYSLDVHAIGATAHDGRPTPWPWAVVAERSIDAP